MAIGITDIVSIDSSLIHRDKNLDLIAKYTDNTWQRFRKFSEKKNDTDQGKRAEEAVLIYLDKEQNIVYIPYDDFRDDGFKKYAPFDGIAFNKTLNIKIVTKIIQKINNEIAASSYGDISSSLRKEIFDSGIRCIEIKSTKINSKKLDKNGAIDFNKVLSNHFLTYPLYTRTGNFSLRDYVFFAKRKMGLKGFLSYEELEKAVIDNERENSSDIYIHVYMDDKKYYLIGYITKELFFKIFEIRKLIKPRKSGRALYFVCGLTSGYSMKKITKEFNC